MNKVGPLPGIQNRGSHDSNISNETQTSILTVTSAELNGPRFCLSPISDNSSENGSTTRSYSPRPLSTLPVITG